MWIHQDPSCGSTRIHHVDPLGSIMGFHQDPSCVSTRIHHVDPPGSIMWTHQDPSCGSTRIYQVDIPGSIMWNHHGVEGEAREIKLLLFETFSFPLFLDAHASQAPGLSLTQSLSHSVTQSLSQSVSHKDGIFTNITNLIAVISQTYVRYILSLIHI